MICPSIVVFMADLLSKASFWEFKDHPQKTTKSIFKILGTSGLTISTLPNRSVVSDFENIKVCEWNQGSWPCRRYLPHFPREPAMSRRWSHRCPAATRVQGLSAAQDRSSKTSKMRMLQVSRVRCIVAIDWPPKQLWGHQ